MGRTAYWMTGFLLLMLGTSLPIAYAFIFQQQSENITQTIGRKWLNGWDKRVKITIDHNDIESDLSNFPVLIHLSNSSGRNKGDVTHVFDELQSDDNRRKIALITRDHKTECYVEIEKWNHTREEAWLWVNVPNINNTTDTDLYLYYDADHTDNADYVGDPNSLPAENVWDDHYKGVWHLTEDASGTGTAELYKDSTANNYHGDDYVSDTGKTGLIGEGQSFDGSSDHISKDVQVISSYPFTVSVWFNRIGKGGHRTLFSITDKDVEDVFYSLSKFGPKVYVVVSNTAPKQGGTGSKLNDGQWHYCVGLFNSDTDKRLYIDGQDNAILTTNVTFNSEVDSFSIGRLAVNTPSEYWSELLDEVRISSTSRSIAWIRACYESGRNDLIIFGSEETA